MEIRNIIIHSVKGELHEVVKDGKKILTRDHLSATIIYNDGTFVEVAANDSIDMANKLAKSKNLTSEDIEKAGIFRYVKNDDYANVIAEINNELKEEKIVKDLENRILQQVNKGSNKDNKSSNRVNKSSKRVNKSSKKKKGVKTFSIVAPLAFVIASIGLGGCIAKNLSSKSETEMVENVEDVTETNTNPEENQNTTSQYKPFTNMTIYELLENNKNTFQNRVMARRFNILNYLNGKFADYYLEEGKNIRFGLRYDELEALDLAYNNYTVEEIQAIYNGSKLDKQKLDIAFKSGILMQTSAYTMSDSRMPVRGYNLIKDNDLKAYARQKETEFYAIKNATGQDKIDKLSAFFKEINSLFPITDDVRTEGIAHYDSKNNIDYEKLVVLTPMIASLEHMYQNLETDVVLNEQAIDYLNSIGMCNYVSDKFEKYVDYVNCCNFVADETHPTEDDYERAINDYLISKNIQVIDDEHREVSKYDSFQNAVNWHFDVIDGYYVGGEVVTTNSYQTTETWSETTNSETTYKTETTEKVVTREEAIKVDEQKVVEQEQAIQKQIEAENKANKEQALKEAETKKQEIQEQNNAEKVQLEKEIIEENKESIQEVIESLPDYVDKSSVSTDPGVSTQLPNPDDAGARLDDNEPAYNGIDVVTEDHIMDVEYVETLQSTNSVAPKFVPVDLPDPNVTGEEFDAQADAVDIVVEYAEEDSVVTDEEVDTQTDVIDIVVEYAEEENAADITLDSQLVVEDSEDSVATDEEVDTQTDAIDIVVEYADEIPVVETTTDSEIIVIDLPDPNVTGEEFDALVDTIIEDMVKNPTSIDEGYQKTK